MSQITVTIETCGITVKMSLFWPTVLEVLVLDSLASLLLACSKATQPGESSWQAALLSLFRKPR